MLVSKSDFTVAVIIPMYNSESTIVRSLLSIEKQSTLPEQVIIIDDGSVDSSKQVVTEYIKKSLLNIELLSQENAGPSSARNKGINAASEHLIAFLDADDEWHASKLEKQLALYADKSPNSKVGIVECYMMDICNELRISRNSPTLSGNHFKDFINSNVIKGTPCVMAPRHVLQSCGGFDESLRFAEDRLLWSKIAVDYEIHTVPEVLVTRHFGSADNITSNPEKNYKFKKEFVAKFLKLFSFKLTSGEIREFKLSNIYDFMTVFYSKKDYGNTVLCFNDMVAVSFSSLYYKACYPLVKYLVALLKIKLKGRDIK